MKKLSLILAIAASILSSVVFAAMPATAMEGKLKDGTMVKIDDHSKLWLVHHDKTEAATNGTYDVWKDGKEWKVEVKDGKAWVE